MQINLPIHKPAGNQKFFNRINSFFFYHQFTIMNCKHFNDSVVTDHTFTYPGKKTISYQIIHSVYIQLAAHQLMKKFFGIIIGKNINAICIFPLNSSFIFFMINKEIFSWLDSFNQSMFQCMGIRPMANIMQKNCDFCRLFFLSEKLQFLYFLIPECIAH